MPTITGTEKSIGFLMKSQRPLNEWYLNDGVAWVDEAAVLAGIDIAYRHPGMPMKIGLYPYWFKDDKTTLERIPVAVIAAALDITITDAADIYTATNVEDALAEVMGYAMSLEIEIAALSNLKQNHYPINLGAYASVADRVSHATETTDYPTGWVLAASGVNLLVTHNLTGRKISSVNVFETDSGIERLCKPFSEAYAGISINGMVITIEGLNPEVLALRIELNFD